jgi:hypothetical protein
VWIGHENSPHRKIGGKAALKRNSSSQDFFPRIFVVDRDFVKRNSFVSQHFAVDQNDFKAIKYGGTCKIQSRKCNFRSQCNRFKKKSFSHFVKNNIYINMSYNMSYNI